MSKAFGRLNNFRDFLNIKNKGVRLSGEHLVINYRHSSNNLFRVGFIIPTSVCKRATKRNKIKRIIKEYLILENKRKQISVDMVFVYYKDFTSKDFSADLKNEISSIMDKIIINTQ